MPIVSGLIIPKMSPTIHFGNIRWLKPVEPFANHHDDDCSEQKEAQDEEEPEEPLGIMSQITVIKFPVSFLNSPAFFSKHSIDLTDMFLHLAKHQFVFLVKQALNESRDGVFDSFFRHTPCPSASDVSKFVSDLNWNGHKQVIESPDDHEPLKKGGRHQ